MRDVCDARDVRDARNVCDVRAVCDAFGARVAREVLRLCMWRRARSSRVFHADLH